MSSTKPLIDSMSGTRGIVGENFDPRIATEIGMAFGSFIGNGPIIVGGDTRTSHDMLKSAMISGLLAVGSNVIDIGKCATPTVQQMIAKHKAKGGVVITASHNPIMWNGIKLMNKTGSFLDQNEFENYQKIRQSQEFALADWEKQGKLYYDNDAINDHVDKVLSLIDITPIKKAYLKVVCDPNNGAGTVTNPILFEKLGIEYKMLNAEPSGIFSHNPEPSKDNLSDIMHALEKGDYDIGFVQDADADRLVILDESGRFIGEDYSLAFCMDQILADTSDDDKKVVVNLSTSMVIDYIANKYDAKITKTKIGEANVTEAIKAQNAQVGGEGNGGVIYPKVGWGRDSLVGMVIALRHLAIKKLTVSEIVSEYPQYVMLREKVAVDSRDDVRPYLEKVKNAFPNAEFNTDDGVKAIFDDAWVHVRPSNTEPIVRIFIEAPSMEKAQGLFSKIK